MISRSPSNLFPDQSLILLIFKFSDRLVDFPDKTGVLFILIARLVYGINRRDIQARYCSAF